MYARGAQGRAEPAGRGGSAGAAETPTGASRGCMDRSDRAAGVPAMRPRRPAPPPGLDELLRGRGVWRMGAPPRPAMPGISTGFDALDARLPERGWPAGALSEVLVRALGSCELALVLPALAAFTRAGRPVALIGPVHLPYPPGLAGRGVDLGQVLVVRGASGHEHDWAAEQSLRSGACAAVALWSRRLDARALRRLKLAAQSGRACGWLLRTFEAMAEPSPALVRLKLEASPRGARVEVLKCRGPRPVPAFDLVFD